MGEKIAKYGKILLITLLVLGVVFTVIGFVDGLRMDKLYAQRSPEQVDVHKSVFYNSTFMIFAYCMLGLAVLTLILSPIFGFIQNPKSLISLAYIGGIVLVLCAITYIIAPGSTLDPEYLKKMNVTPGTESMVDFFMIFTYIVVAGTVGVVGYSAVRKLINK